MNLRSCAASRVRVLQLVSSEYLASSGTIYSPALEYAERMLNTTAKTTSFGRCSQCKTLEGLIKSIEISLTTLRKNVAIVGSLPVD